MHFLLVVKQDVVSHWCGWLLISGQAGGNASMQTSKSTGSNFLAIRLNSGMHDKVKDKVNLPILSTKMIR